MSLFNKKNQRKNEYKLRGELSKKGFDRWWHSFTAKNAITGEERTFFLEFYLCNPDVADDASVSGKSASYLSVKVVCLGEEATQIGTFYSMKEVLINGKAPFSITTQECFLSETRSFGKISVSKEECQKHPEVYSDAGKVEWNLDIDKKIAYNLGYQTSCLGCCQSKEKNFWHGEGIKTFYSGTICVNGEKFIVSPASSYGYADKEWGSEFEESSLWINASHLVSRKIGELNNSAVLVYIGQAGAFGGICYEGKEFEFNPYKCAKNTKTKYQCAKTDDEMQFKVVQQSKRFMMKVQLRCKKDKMLTNMEVCTKNDYSLGGNAKGLIRLYKKEKGTWNLVDVIEIYHAGCAYKNYL